MYQALNGPSVYGQINVTTAVEVKVGGSRHPDRQVVTIQPLDGDVWFGYDSGLTSSNGSKIFKGQFFPIEMTDLGEVWLLAVTGTVKVAIAELA